MRKMTKWQAMGGAFLAGLVLMGIGGGVAFAEYSSFQYMGQKYIQSGEEKQYSETITIPEDVQKAVLYQGGEIVIDESIPDGQIKVDVTYWSDSKTMGNNLHVEEQRRVFLPYNGTLEQQIPVYTVQVYSWGSGVDEWAAFQQLLKDLKQHEFYSYDYRPTTYTYTMSSATRERVWAGSEVPSGDIMYAEEVEYMIEEREREQSEDALAQEWEELERQREELELQREQLETDTVESAPEEEVTTGIMSEINHVKDFDGKYMAQYDSVSYAEQWTICEGTLFGATTMDVTVESDLLSSDEVHLIVEVDGEVCEDYLLTSGERQKFNVSVPAGYCSIYLQSPSIKGTISIDMERWGADIDDIDRR